MVKLQMRTLFANDGVNTRIVHAPRETRQKDPGPKTKHDGNNNDETPGFISPDISPCDFYEHCSLYFLSEVRDLKPSSFLHELVPIKITYLTPNT